MTEKDSDRINIVIVGAGKAGELISQDIVANEESPFALVGFVDDDTEKQGVSVEGIPVLG